MIDELVEESIQYIREAMYRGDVSLLSSYMTYGFMGFDNMSDEDLRLEYESSIEDPMKTNEEV
jgi:hypothetical protein